MDHQVERFFPIMTQKAIGRGSFPNVRELIRKINAFVKGYVGRYRPIHPGQDPTTFYSYLRDMALGSGLITRRGQ